MLAGADSADKNHIGSKEMCTHRTAVQVAMVGLFLTVSACRADINTPSCECSTGPVEEDWIGLWEGHSYSWDDLSHRIAFLRAGVDMPTEGGAFVADLGILGGSWADGRHYRDHPNYTLGHSRVRSEELVAWYDEVPLVIGPGGRAEVTVDIDLADLDLPERRHWAIALRGICMDMDVPFLPGYEGSYTGDEGWTPQGFGALVSPLSFVDKGHRANFVASIHFTPGRLDRVHHNEALEFAQVNAHIRYALLGFDDGALQGGLLEASAFYESAGEAHTNIEPIPEAQRRLQIIGQADMPIGLPLLRGFDFEFNATTGEDTPGRYLREWSAQIEAFDYEPNLGVANLLMDGYASHSSAIQEGDLEVDFQASVDLLQLADPQAEVVRGSVVGEQSTLGNWSHEVPPIED